MRVHFWLHYILTGTSAMLSQIVGNPIRWLISPVKSNCNVNTFTAYSSAYSILVSINSFEIIRDYLKYKTGVLNPVCFGPFKRNEFTLISVSDSALFMHFSVLFLYIKSIFLAWILKGLCILYKLISIDHNTLCCKHFSPAFRIVGQVPE